ncbi:MAG TPA: TMEM165/GDT1 family protein [Candidatus Altiarchaeales archaeon]|nr:TMEM165/GDT1 family protein [Candidatus Altiarchaeales archaeon]
MKNVSDIVIPLIIADIAELGDKTQLLILLLSSKTENHFQLFIGAMLAFLITDGHAIFFGDR